MRQMLLFCLFSLSFFGVYSLIPFSGPKVVPGGSPRFASYNISGGGQGLAMAYEFVSGNQKQIVTSLSADGNNWGPPVVVSSMPLAVTDLSNPHLYQLPSGRLLCTFRHHTIVSGQPTIYRIEVCYTDDMKGWLFSGTVEAFSTTSGRGIWEPFLYQIRGDPALYCAYSKELPNGQQNIVARVSTDSGKTWGAERIISHTEGSRDGMPTITPVADGSLLAVFEGFWAGTWGKFTVNSRRSFDGGRTWNDAQVIHISPSNKNSGAPWSTTLADGRTVVVFMSDEDTPGAPNWPNDASIKLLVGTVKGDKMVWGDLQTVANPPSFWPAAYFWETHRELRVSYSNIYVVATF